MIACRDCAWCDVDHDGLCHHPKGTSSDYDYMNATIAPRYLTVEQSRTGFCGFNAGYFHPLDAEGVEIRGGL